MSNSSKKRITFFITGMASLLMGAMIYLLFRPTVIFAQCLDDEKWVLFLRQLLSWLDLTVVKFHLVDYLWALSLSCGLHLIFCPDLKGSLFCTLTVALYGGLFELLQSLGVISGTGDWFDILGYILAGITVNILNSLRRWEL